MDGATNQMSQIPDKVSASFKRLNPQIYGQNTTINSALQNTEPERNQASTLGDTVQGEAEGIRRTLVRFTGFRVKPLDPDNFAGSVKDLLDGLRHAHLIHGDEWWRIDLQTTQVRVKRYADEKTLVEIETE